MKTDVLGLLLADVFENFMDLCMKLYGLDPSRYLTLPSFSWDACLKYTDAGIDLLTDPEMHLFIESGIRGGIFTISNRFTEANNKYMSTEEYDPNVESYSFGILTSITFMVLSCPKNYQPETLNFYQTLKFLILIFKIKIKVLILVILSSATLHGYPAELHDSHNDYPLAPESIVITANMLSPHSRSFNRRHVECQKLAPNLNGKKKYVTRFGNLKLYLQLGLKLTKIHRILGFSQAAWMDSYVRFNSEKRILANSEFERDLFKLAVNSIFGKSLQSNRRHKKCSLFAMKIR